jgi:DNA repair protein RadC
VLAVKDERSRSARRLRRSSILDRSARRDSGEVGNPAQEIPRIAVMNDITLPLDQMPTHIRKSRPRRIPPIESGADLLHPNAGLSLEEVQVLAQARAILLRIAGKPGVSLSAPSATREYLKTLLAPQERELFLVLALDNRHRVIASEILFAGTIDGASVHPREVVKCALRHNAAAVIFSHNHPSGVAEPSQADELITKRLRDALALVDIRVLDHFVIGAGSTCSFAERGLL